MNEQGYATTLAPTTVSGGSSACVGNSHPSRMSSAAAGSALGLDIARATTPQKLGLL